MHFQRISCSFIHASIRISLSCLCSFAHLGFKTDRFDVTLRYIRYRRKNDYYNNVQAFFENGIVKSLKKTSKNLNPPLIRQASAAAIQCSPLRVQLYLSRAGEQEKKEKNLKLQPLATYSPAAAIASIKGNRPSR